MEDMDLSSITEIRRVEKPWGHELLLARTERYAGKILCIRGGHRLSLQHHTVKDETLFLLEGQAGLEIEGGALEPSYLPMIRDTSYRVLPGQRHRLIAVTDARVLELSTPELEDVVRWADDYGRSLIQDERPMLECLK